MLKQAWCNKQDLITQPGNCNDSHRSVCKHLQKDEGECKYHDSSIIQQLKGTHTCAHTADLQQNWQIECPLKQIYIKINRHPLQFSFQWLSVCQKHRLVTGGSEVRWVTYGCFVLFICACTEIHMFVWEIKGDTGKDAKQDWKAFLRSVSCPVQTHGRPSCCNTENVCRRGTNRICSFTIWGPTYSSIFILSFKGWWFQLWKDAGDWLTELTAYAQEGSGFF